MITITSSQLHHHNHIITHHIITPVCEEVVEVVVPLALSAENVQLPVARMEEHGVAGPRLDPGPGIPGILPIPCRPGSAWPASSAAPQISGQGEEMLYYCSL